MKKAIRELLKLMIVVLIYLLSFSATLGILILLYDIFKKLL